MVTLTDTLTVVTGSEELLVERAVRDLVRSSSEVDTVRVEELEAILLRSGDLLVHTSPSLFEDAPVLVVRGVEQLVQSKSDHDEPLKEIVAYLEAPSPDAHVVLVHAGGVGGKAVLAAAKKARATMVVTPAPKGTKLRQHRREFVRDEATSAGCSITPQGIEVLIDSVGTGLRDLAGACVQLASDRTDGTQITDDDVRRYFGGRAEVSGFEVADQIVAGRTADALVLLRHSRQSGTTPVLFPAALARSLRQLALVAAAPRSASPTELAAATGMPDWKVNKVRQAARDWTERGLVAAINAVAEGDAAVKGGQADADYALEQMLITVGRARRLV